MEPGDGLPCRIAETAASLQVSRGKARTKRPSALLNCTVRADEVGEAFASADPGSANPSGINHPRQCTSRTGTTACTGGYDAGVQRGCGREIDGGPPTDSPGRHWFDETVSRSSRIAAGEISCERERIARRR